MQKYEEIRQNNYVGNMEEGICRNVWKYVRNMEEYEVGEDQR